MACQANCAYCSSIVCLACSVNYVFNQNLTCQLPCTTPCATCDPNNVLTCLSCISGYTFNGVSCVPDTSCNKDYSCFLCPFGYSLLANSNGIRFNQTCIQCNSSANCARCSLTNSSECLNCLSGFYLDGTACLPCAPDCLECVNYNMCIRCRSNSIYIHQFDNYISGTETLAILAKNCTPCSGYCATC